MIKSSFKIVDAHLAAEPNQGLKNYKTISFLVDGLFTHDTHVQLECAGLLRKVGEETPRLLYPFFNSLTDLLERADALLEFEVLKMLNLIAPVDCQHKTDFLRTEQT